MKSYGVRFQRSLGGTLHLGRTNAFFLGGGKALMNSYYAAAQKRGIRVLYNADIAELDIRDGVFKSGKLLVDGRPFSFGQKLWLSASGGFESNLDWLEEAWGRAGAELPRSRYAVQQRETAEATVGPRRRTYRRPEAVPLRSRSMAARPNSMAAL